MSFYSFVHASGLQYIEKALHFWDKYGPLMFLISFYTVTQLEDDQFLISSRLLNVDYYEI